MAEREFKEKSMAYIRICPVCHGIIEIDEGDYYKTTYMTKNHYYDKDCYERKLAEEIGSRKSAREHIRWELSRGLLEEYTNGKRVR